MKTCSCGQCEYRINDDEETPGLDQEVVGLLRWYLVGNEMRPLAKMGRCSIMKFCPKCGDKLCAKGEVESRADLKRDAERFRKLKSLRNVEIWVDEQGLPDAPGYGVPGRTWEDLADALQEPDPRPVAGRGVYAAGLEAMLGEDALPGAGNEGAEGGE